MIVKPLTYCMHVLTSLFLQQPSQIDTFPISIYLFIYFYYWYMFCRFKKQALSVFELTYL